VIERYTNRAASNIKPCLVFRLVAFLILPPTKKLPRIELEQINFNYSMKNIPISSKENYFIIMITNQSSPVYGESG